MADAPVGIGVPIGILVAAIVAVVVVTRLGFTFSPIPWSGITLGLGPGPQREIWSRPREGMRPVLYLRRPRRMHRGCDLSPFSISLSFSRPRTHISLICGLRGVRSGLAVNFSATFIKFSTHGTPFGPLDPAGQKTWRGTVKKLGFFLSRSQTQSNLVFTL